MTATRSTSVVTTLVVALVLLCGCSTATAQPQVTAELAGAVDALRAMPGVADAQLTSSDDSGMSELNVGLTPEVTEAQLAEIGQAAANIQRTSRSQGVSLRNPVLEQGSGVFSYFAGLADAELAQELNFWFRLNHAAVGTDVTIQTASDAAAASTTAASAVPRVALVRVGDPEALEASLAALGAINDPLAQPSQWEFLNLAQATSAQIVSQGFPAAEKVLQLARFGALFAQTSGVASVQFRSDETATPEFTAELAIFDPELDGEDHETATARFHESTAWATLEAFLSELEQQPPKSFTLSMLSNALASGGNLRFEVMVDGCTFSADPEAPQLTADLGAYWLAHHSPQREVPGETCQVLAS